MATSLGPARKGSSRNSEISFLLCMDPCAPCLARFQVTGVQGKMASEWNFLCSCVFSQSCLRPLSGPLCGNDVILSRSCGEQKWECFITDRRMDSDQPTGTLGPLGHAGISAPEGNDHSSDKGNLCHCGTRSSGWRKKGVLKQNTKTVHMRPGATCEGVLAQAPLSGSSHPRLTRHQNVATTLAAAQEFTGGQSDAGSISQCGIRPAGLPGAPSCHPETRL